MAARLVTVVALTLAVASWGAWAKPAATNPAAAPEVRAAGEAGKRGPSATRSAAAASESSRSSESSRNEAARKNEASRNEAARSESARKAEAKRAAEADAEKSEADRLASEQKAATETLSTGSRDGARTTPAKAEPAKSEPAKAEPAKSDVPRREPAGAPTAPRRPATRPAASDGFPSAREMAERLMGARKAEEMSAKVAYIDLGQPVVEGPPAFAIFGDTSLTLQSVLSRLARARDDAEVRGVLVTIGPMTSFNLSQAQEIRDALAEVRKAGKRVFVYADSYSTASYIAASGSRDICMMEGGEIMMPGVGFETMFAKGLLDKVGVKADYVQIGQYKGADEQYTRTEPSKEMRGEMNKILDALFEQIVDGIAYQRNISKFDVKEAIDNVFLPARLAKQRRFVDHLVDQDGLRDLMKKELGREVMLLGHYGLVPREPVDLSNPFTLLSSLTRKPPESPRPAVAVIHVEGTIVDGASGEGGLFGEGGTIGSEDLRKALRMAVRDPRVGAIVLRIDSPGGSASASEVMWQAARRAAKDKPVIVSIGGMAASGGYYVACAGDHIFADPSAIVGSIGVVGGKFVFKDLFEKLGIRTESFSRGNNAGLFSNSAPFSESQRRLVTGWMQQTYEQFTTRVTSQRGKKIKDIDEVAHGRIFLARQARDLGMVDELGGIDKAVAHAAKAAGLAPGTYDVKVVPGTRTLGDMLRGEGPEAAAIPALRPRVRIAELEALELLSPSSARLLRQQLQALVLLQQRPVVLVSPVVVQLR